jgi:5-methylcytosine-specific restriction endonuclease McrA
MSTVPKRLRKAVVERAAQRCEYCQLSQLGQEATFHLDHILPQYDGGETTLENLALACVSCSLRKESRRCAVDPQTKRLVPFFHP